MSNTTHCTCGHELRFWLVADIEQVPTRYIWEAYCPHCKKEFVTTNEKQVYCKDMCGQAERTKAYRKRKREALKNK